MNLTTKSSAARAQRFRTVSADFARIAFLTAFALWCCGATVYAQNDAPVGKSYDAEYAMMHPFEVAHEQMLAEERSPAFIDLRRRQHEAFLIAQQGRKLESEGQWQQAVAKYKASLDIYTDQYGNLTYVAVANAYLHHGFSHIAADWYRKYTYSNSGKICSNSNSHPLFQYCMLLCNAGEWDEAATIYNRARAIIGVNYYRDQVKLLPETMDLPVADPVLFKAYLHTILAITEPDSKPRFVELATAQRLAPRNATVAFFAAMDGPDERDRRKSGLLHAAELDRSGSVKSLVATELENPYYKDAP